ncbi:uncharacterized protein ACLA_077870 [Aspergillus clavatus NRRL 1]|uniref:DUF1330 domain-containing protein n=1 Tax=Aspergillus clavatus (strain ATCC 1007 / CBS 513.65 / DSM 816 / NCTC 3887 / NRRL 1 / QM 1276 / 107) TaxID=344612 RepID=A1CLR1_ASPCL|nr:uncharacterized protein ACLA_077870 [Aspergillus clavatus NRRL 1]EAW09040.1 hypothetical protein ACLA_077870 [Aspergillus clavatus NRRL 1]
MAYTKQLPESLCIVRATMVSFPSKPAAHAYFRNAPAWLPRLEGTTVYRGAFGGEEM